ncbi:MAG: hypothetical protein ACLQRH_21310 [Acidimicrobiales bacterium]
MNRSLATVAAILVIAGSIVTGAAQAGAMTNAQAQAKVLSLSNMPAGWIVDNASGGNDTYTGCMKILHTQPQGVAMAGALYVDGSVPALGEILAGGKGASARFNEVNRVFGHCKTLGATVGGQSVTGTVQSMSFPEVGNASGAYSASLTIKGFTLEADVVYSRSAGMPVRLSTRTLANPILSRSRVS